MHPDWQIAVADADPQQSALKWIERGKAEGINGISAYSVAADGEGRALRAELAAIDADVVIIDLPPAIESVSLRAALYGNLMLVPVGPSALDIEAARDAVSVCEEALGMDGSKEFMLVPSKVRAGTAAGRELASVLAKWGRVSKSSIGLRQAYADAATSGEGITTYAPKSTAHAEIVALAEEIAAALQKREGKENEQETSVAC